MVVVGLRHSEGAGAAIEGQPRSLRAEVAPAADCLAAACAATSPVRIGTSAGAVRPGLSVAHRRL
jgi:hypothetical protein